MKEETDEATYGEFARQPIDRKEMEIKKYEWEPFVKIQIHWFFGQKFFESLPRRDPINGMPCLWKPEIPCVCP